ncbi:MAG: polysulfide reductase NrfD [Chloroflexi bacterium]|nr:polysulfide reductase NrfD [Chloroflexota bacterium]
MKYAKIIDNRKCIGCHACSVACKEENQVPLGVFRTWVKYIEKGKFPNTRRYFQVTRCNQCENPPCVRICPTGAMYQRTDGIVEFNAEHCIACKACLQACPYDAIYVDPETHTAAKCHFCAHRLERNLEPACVIVCPERAIIVGDMDNPRSEVSRLLAREQVSVRKPEQGTNPKLFYIDGEAASLNPLAAARPPTWMWADVGASAYGGNGSESGPIHHGGAYAGALTQTVYDVPHEIPWGWKVSTYLWTKSIGAGAFFVPALFLGFGMPLPNAFAALAAFLSLVFIGITTFFLVWDLKQPRRFLKIVLRPQLRSWLARGAFILMGFSALGGLWFLASAAQEPVVRETIALPLDWLTQTQNALTFPAAFLAIFSAIYSAFLFSQAEGRDLWQSPPLALNLFLHAGAAGSGALLIAAMFGVLPVSAMTLLVWAFVVSLAALIATQILADFAIPPATTNARHGHDLMIHGYYGAFFWGGIAAESIGLALAIIALATSAALASAIGGVCALAGLYAVLHAWVQAGQRAPNS